MSPNPLSTILHRTWWVLLLRGLVAIAFGVLTWAQPAVSLAALVLTFGAFTFVDGLLGVYSAIQGATRCAIGGCCCCGAWPAWWWACSPWSRPASRPW
ncbi:DUF308 domain-containing protein [Delftia tsuruhatensis]|uniref:DUF308 domain-containing protein n=1 Tax=Delftia tsuruhatensis TaxID=180282 RepID=UPI00370AFC1E